LRRVSDNDYNFSKTEIPLKKDHHWTASPGFRIAALDRGAIRFEFAQDWICIPDAESVKFYDHEPPADNCRLAVARKTFSGQADRTLLDDMVLALTHDDPRGLRCTTEVIHIRKSSLELAWVEFQFTDPALKYEARSRFCLARGSGVYALVTFEFWQEDREKFLPLWDHVLETLTLGEFILDPTSGMRVQRNNPQTG
jgi:hypothetical protein